MKFTKKIPKKIWNKLEQKENQMSPEEWNAEWTKYFDELDEAVERMDQLADEAQDKGLEILREKLEKAADALMIVAMACAKFIDNSNYDMILQLYRQNPLLQTLLDSSLQIPGTPYTQPIKKEPPTPES